MLLLLPVASANSEPRMLCLGGSAWRKDMSASVHWGRVVGNQLRRNNLHNVLICIASRKRASCTHEIHIAAPWHLYHIICFLFFVFYLLFVCILGILTYAYNTFIQ